MEHKLLKQALSKLKDVKHGESFLLKDLFCGLEWNRLDIGTRIKLGKKFFEEMLSHDEISAIGKSKDNQQQYQKL